VRVYGNVETSLGPGESESPTARSDMAFRLVTRMREIGESPLEGGSGEPARIAKGGSQHRFGCAFRHGRSRTPRVRPGDAHSGPASRLRRSPSATARRTPLNGKDPLMYVLIAVAVAVFIGMRSERARQAHHMWANYKDRLASMRGLRMKETMNAVLGVCALVAVVIMISGIGG
jgi:hypothetical protein